MQYTNRTILIALAGTVAFTCELTTYGCANADDSPPAAAADADSNAPEAASLVRALYAREAWIDSARSVLIRIQIEQTSTKDGVQRPLDYSRTVFWCWDESRIRYEHLVREGKGKRVSSSTTKIWDGELAVEHGKSDNAESYVLTDKVAGFFEENSMFDDWGIVSRHRFWWWPRDVARSHAGESVAPEDFEPVGEEVINERPCHVVQSAAGNQRFHIGAEDGRLYRRTWFQPRGPGGFAEADILKLYQKIGGQRIRTIYHWEPWLESLKSDERRRTRRNFAAALFDVSRPSMRQTFDDYRELAPGCWFPFRRSTEYYESRKVAGVDDPVLVIGVRLDEAVTEMAIDDPLPDEMFRIELMDGVPTNDQRDDVVINYEYRKDQTEAERKSLRDAAREKSAEHKMDIERRLAPVKARVGQAPPPLPAAGWVTGAPLAWEGLRGKVVLLHFWDSTGHARPSQQELPVMQGWHEKSDESGMVVIGVHRATNDPDAVAKMLAEFGADYPVVIDGPGKDADSLGLLHDWFGIEWRPFTIIVDARGRVAGYGQLWHWELVDRKGIYYPNENAWLPSIAPQLEQLTGKPAK